MKVHDVFHVSFLKKYIKDVEHVIDWSVICIPGGARKRILAGTSIYIAKKDVHALELSNQAS